MNTRSTFLFLRFLAGIFLLFNLVLRDVTPAAAALRCYVKANANGLNDGSSWANAYKRLQSALGASSCTEVWVAKGTYKPTTGTDRTGSFVLKNGVVLYGGFAGVETLLTERNPTANPTILSGDLGTAGDMSDNSYHVVTGTGTNNTAILNGFIITRGNASDSAWPNNSGGGMFNGPGSPTVANVVFSGNSALDYGGGMYNYANSKPGLVRVSFNGNSAGYAGGGIYDWDSSSVLTNVTLSGNSAGSLGGGFYEHNGSAKLSNVTFIGNSAGYGGGMQTNGYPILTNVTFSGNSAYQGGGMFNWDLSPTLTNVTFSGNTASGDGGGIYNYSGSNAVIQNTILYGDTGGEIVSDGTSTATVSYSIVQGGYAGTGNIDANPLLGPLQYNGGLTQTMALGYGSPAIDRGTNSGCPGKDQRGVLRPQDGDRDGTAQCDIGATESRLLIKAFRSAGALDGWISESTETSGVGSTAPGDMNATQGTFSVGDDASNRQARSVLSFNTASLPDNAVMVSATLKIKYAGLVGTNPFTTHGNILVDIRSGAFSDNAVLQPEDFQAVASRDAAMTIPNSPISGWYSGRLGALGFGYINKTGLTQLRLRFALDDNNDLSADYLKFYSGDSTTTAYQPKLIIKYYLP